MLNHPNQGPEAQTLASIAASHSIDPGEIIDPVKLAVRLIEAGESVLSAARLCGVNRTQLYRKIKQPEESQKLTK